METFSALLALCEESPVIGEFPSQRPLTQSFDVFFDLRLNKRDAGDLRRHRDHYDVTLIDWTYVRQILGALGIDSEMWHTGPTVARHQYTAHFLFAVATVVLFPYRRIIIYNTERERWRLRRIKRCCICVKSDRDGTGGYANNFITVCFISWFVAKLALIHFRNRWWKSLMLWSFVAIWWHRSGSKLVRVMAWFLTKPLLNRYHQRCFVAFTSQQFPKKCSWTLIRNMCSEITLWP